MSRDHDLSLDVLLAKKGHPRLQEEGPHLWDQKGNLADWAIGTAFFLVNAAKLCSQMTQLVRQCPQPNLKPDLHGEVFMKPFLFCVC